MKRKVYVNLLALIFGVAVLSVSLVAYSMTVAKETSPKTAVSKSKILPQIERAISDDIDTEVVKKEPKKELDISIIQLPIEFESGIKLMDAANADKNLINCKRLILELNVPDLYQNEIGKRIKEKRNVPDILIAYKFLSENYGTVGELEKMLNQKEAGKTFAQLFKEYNETHPEFVPSNFKEGYLEELLKTPGITADDIMIADRISQKGLKTFEELIELRKQGTTWQEINTGFGIINTSEKLPHVSMTSSQVKQQMKQSGLPEKQVVEALVMAGRLDQDSAGVIDKIKAGKQKEDIFAEAYEEKYR